MTGFYDITTTIKNQLIQDAFVNTVTEGDIFEVDLKKQTIFPLSHIMVNQTTREGHALRFNITVMCMDIVDKSKEAITDVFTGNDNEQDVLNTQLAVALRLVEVLDRGSNRKTYQLDGNAVFEPFTERFENYLAGWSVTFDVMIANTMTACDAGAALVTCPNATYTITDDAGNTLYSGSITSGGSLTQEITDSTAVLKDTAGSTISTTSINAQASADITAPDATYSNSDASYSGNIVSGGSLVLPDSQINVNGVDEGDVVSVKTVDVNITDGTNPVTPDSVSLSGNILTVQVPAGGAAPVGATLMKTGQTTSYATGDDGDLEAGRATDFFTLAVNNPFGNTNRFTDELGGSTYTNNIVIDWSTYDGSTVLGYYRTDRESANWNDAIDYSLTLSVGGFTSGWRLTNIHELLNVFNYQGGSVRLLNYPPFNINQNAYYWASTTAISATTSAYAYWNSTGGSTTYAKTQAFIRMISCRTFTVTGTTLS